MKKYALVLFGTMTCFLMTNAFADCGCAKRKKVDSTTEELAADTTHVANVTPEVIAPVVETPVVETIAVEDQIQVQTEEVVTAVNTSEN